VELLRRCGTSVTPPGIAPAGVGTPATHGALRLGLAPPATLEFGINHAVRGHDNFSNLQQPRQWPNAPRAKRAAGSAVLAVEGSVEKQKTRQTNPFAPLFSTWAHENEPNARVEIGCETGLAKQFRGGGPPVRGGKQAGMPSPNPFLGRTRDWGRPPLGNGCHRSVVRLSFQPMTSDPRPSRIGTR
jgi:hypothetical protein